MTLRQRLLDKSLWTIALSALLALSSVSLFFCPTAHAGSPVPVAPAGHTPTEASKTALMLQPDDGGDELLEHWSDPKFGREERAQMLGIIAALVCAGGMSVYKKRALRRAHRRD